MISDTPGSGWVEGCNSQGNRLIVGDMTVVDLLRRRARDEPSRVAITFLLDGEENEVHESFGALGRRSGGLGHHLAARLGAGDRVLLAYPPGPEFLAGFFGCLYAGLVAVPVAPPRPNQSLAALEAITVDSGASAALTTRRMLDALRPRLEPHSPLARLAWIAADAADIPDDGSPARIVEPGALAYVQYTSGSTSEPRGVMIGHDTLMANLAAIRERAAGPEGGTTVSWLPFFHDMGLVSTVLQSLYLGGRCVLMPPLHFLQKPIRWLRAISTHRAETSGAPNFAYDLCSRSIRPAEAADLELGCWTGAFCSAEPVRSETLDRFAKAFTASGFRREAFYPCYGLAEATVFVTGVDRGALPTERCFDSDSLQRGSLVEVHDDNPRARRLIGCGTPAPGTRIAIVDPLTLQECPPNRFGEIWVAGPGVGRGYWGKPDASAETFEARIGNQGPFLRTGDLGFVSQGELFIAGRRKELIKIRGGNYHPIDLERTAWGANPALRPDGGAAFGIDVAGEERLVMVHEVERTVRTA